MKEWDYLAFQAAWTPVLGKLEDNEMRVTYNSQAK